MVAAAGHGLDEAVGGEAGQGLADGGDGDPEAGGEIIRIEAGGGGEVAEQDGIEDPLAHGLGDGFTERARGIRRRGHHAAKVDNKL